MCGGAFLNPVRLWMMQYLCKMDNRTGMEIQICFIFMVNGPFFAKNVVVWLWVTFCEFAVRNVVTTKSTA